MAAFAAQRTGIVYTSDVENFLHYPWNYYFQSPVSVMPHDL